MSKKKVEVRVCVFEGVAWTEENKVLFRKLAEEFANDSFCVYLREDQPEEKKNYSGGFSGESFSYPPGALHLDIYKPSDLKDVGFERLGPQSQ